MAASLNRFAERKRIAVINARPVGLSDFHYGSCFAGYEVNDFRRPISRQLDLLTKRPVQFPKDAASYREVMLQEHHFQ